MRASHAEQNRRMFDGVSRRYDLLNALLSLGLDRCWRRRAVQTLAPQAGQRILDIGCGTGDIILENLRQEPTAVVTGLDPAVAMLGVARDKLAGCGRAVSLVRGDATDLGFPDSSFARVISAFCIRNIGDRERAFAEMHRVAEPGGVMVALELTNPTSPQLGALHRVYNRLVVPTLGRLLSSPAAYRYLVDSITNFPSAPAIMDEITGAGFEPARAIPLTAGIVTLFVGATGSNQGKARPLAQSSRSESQQTTP